MYPILIRAVSLVSGLRAPLAGLVVSTLALAAAIFIYVRYVAGTGGHRHREHLHGSHVEFPAGSNFGWFIFLFSPASWVFLHPHTESLYVLVLVLTLACWVRGKWLLAAVFAGLAALTKNQGTFLALATGLAAAQDVYGRDARVTNGNSRTRGWQRSFRIFLACGLISGGLYALYPLYQYVVAGDPFLYLSSQIHWRPEMTVGSYFKTFWFGNPWQNLRPGSLLHQGFFFALVYFVWRYATRFPRNLIWIYFALHTLIMPSPGELVSDLRYASVLIVVWLFAGNEIACKPKFPGVALVGSAGVWMLLHQVFLVSAILGRWAY